MTKYDSFPKFLLLTFVGLSKQKWHPESPVGELVVVSMMVVFGPLPRLFVCHGLVYMAANQMISAHLSRHVCDINSIQIASKQEGGW